MMGSNCRRCIELERRLARAQEAMDVAFDFIANQRWCDRAELLPVMDKLKQASQPDATHEGIAIEG